MIENHAPSEAEPLRIVELFSGIGAQAMALRLQGIPYTVVGTSEVDAHAMRAYEAIHGPVPQLGDISALKHLPECDLVTYSFPCQDLSTAGHRRGMEEGSGTRSSLLWEVGRLIRDAIARGHAPRHLLMENVPAILFRTNIDAFNRWISELSELGYTSTYAVLNATDFDVPQSRRRCFMVSSRDGRTFAFPTGRPTERRLRDVMEDPVDESYYLTDEQISRFEAHKARHDAMGHGLGWEPRTPDELGRTVTDKPYRHGQTFLITDGDLEAYRQNHDASRPEVIGFLNDSPYRMANKVWSAERASPTICSKPPACADPSVQIVGDLNRYGYNIANRVYGTDGVSPTLCVFDGALPRIDVSEFASDCIAYPSNTQRGFMDAHDGDGLVLGRPTKARGTVQPQRAPMLTCTSGCGTGAVVRDGDGDSARLRIRQLTPRECWRLMGFPDWAYDAVVAIGMPKTQLYRQAGNSIVVPVLQAIFKAMYQEDGSWRNGFRTLDDFGGSP